MKIVFLFINERKTWPLFYPLSYVMHTIEKKRDNSCHNPGYPIPVQGKQEIAILQICRGGMPPDPPRSSCLWHSTARTVHVHQLNHCIWYFQMLPKTLPKYTVEKSNLLLMLSGDLDCPWGRLKNPHTIQGEELGKRPRSLSDFFHSGYSWWVQYM